MIGARVSARKLTALPYLPCALVIGFGMVLMDAPVKAWPRLAISVVAVLGLVGVEVIIVIGFSNPDPNSFGPHNFADYVPVFLIVTGIAAWFSNWRGRRS